MNNVVIHKTTIVNVQEINVYRNTDVRNSVVVVNENHFGRGPIKSTRLTQVNEKGLRPIHNAPQVTATPASFVPRENRGIRPPEKVLERPVVATRTPHPREEAPAGVERKTAPVRVPTPKPRIVSVPQKPEAAPVLQRPPFGQSKVERRTTDRAQAPAPPKVDGQRRPEQALGRTPSVTRQTPPSQQREPQVAGPSPAKPQPSGLQPEADRTRSPGPQKMESPQRPERSSGDPLSVTRQTPPSQQREPQVAGPSPAKPQPSGRPTEAARPPARVLPGEPANRLSPNRPDARSQQQRGRTESQRPFPPDNTPGNEPQRRPGN